MMTAWRLAKAYFRSSKSCERSTCFYDVEIFSEDVWRSDCDVILRKCRAFFDATWRGSQA